MKKLSLFLVPLAALALLAWLLMAPTAHEGADSMTNAPAVKTAPAAEAEPAPAQPPIAEATSETRSSAEIPSTPVLETAAAFDRNAVYGTVVDSAGKPIAGASISLFEGGWDFWEQEAAKSSPKQETKSGEDGRFKIAGLAPFDSFRLLARAPGFGIFVHHSARPGKDLKIVLAKESSLLGEVTDLQSKLPIVGAKISYRIQGSHEEEATSDGEGKFRLPLSSQQQISILVAADGYAWQRFTMNLQPGETKERSIGMRKAGDLAGEIYDIETNQPIAGAEIEFWGQVRGRSDAQGRFRVQAVESSTNNAFFNMYNNFQVHAPGYCSLHQDLSQIAAGDLRLPLLRGVEIEGVVHDPAGKAVAGATIQTSLEQEDGENPMSGRKGQFISSSFSSTGMMRMAPRGSNGKFKFPRGSSLANSKLSRSQKTDAQGKFHLEGLVPAAQAFSVSATHPDFCQGAQGGLKLSEPGQKAFAEIALARGASLEGRVTMGGKPANAQVWVRSDETWLESETNDGGEYGFKHLAAGSYKIGANPEGMQDWGEDKGESLQLEEGGTHRKDLKIDASSTRPVTGKVLSSEGKPVPNARINAWSNAAEDGRFVSREGKSLADGSFRLELPEMGNALYQVTAWDGANWASQPKVAPGAENVEIRFSAQGKLRLRVLDSRTSEPVSSFQVYFRDASGKRNRSMMLTTDASGLAECDVAFGVYDLTIVAMGQGFRNAQIPGVEISQKSSDPLRVDMLPGVKATIKLVGDANSTISDPLPWISLMPVTGGPGPRMFMGNQGAQLEESGQCTISGLTPGKFRVQINPPSILLEPAEITVPDAETASFEIHWKVKPEEKPKGE